MSYRKVFGIFSKSAHKLTGAVCNDPAGNASFRWRIDAFVKRLSGSGYLKDKGEQTIREVLRGVVYSTVALVLMTGGLHAAEPWPMYQGNPSHTGYLPMTLNPDEFSLRWEKQVGSFDLNPVTAADGKVFVSEIGYFNDPGLYTLDAEDGAVLWGLSFGDVYSVNPPSYGYGNVYIQTGNHSSDTYLRAYDAETGALVFRAPHYAQWERYYAPTIYDGKVYINGGYYGGMYAFDAYDGTQLWFLGLNQYDEWTPAVDETYAYAYTGEYSPKLSVVDRLTGVVAYEIPDPNFVWNGWSMDLAPVLGSQNNVLAIHDGRLISFDLEDRAIGWELQRSFQGQPSVAAGVIYAIDAGAMTAWDEATAAMLWAWEPPESSLIAGNIIVTDSHVIAASDSHVYAVNLETHQSDWSYAASGHLSLGYGVLYIAGGTGELTAINALNAEIVNVDIDIAPKRDPNRIRPGRGHCAVAILSDESFDVTQVNPVLVRFGPAEAEPMNDRIIDVDRDGDMDHVFHFLTEETGIVCGDTAATLIGETFEGVPVTGTDEIVTVGCR